MSLVVAWLGLMIAAAPPAADAGSVLAALEREGRQLVTMRADFEQARTNVVLDEKESTSGKVLLQVPGRFRWDYLRPQPSAMAIKDGRFERYFPRTKQVFRGPARGEADLLVGFGPGSRDLGRKYEVTLAGEESVSGQPAWVLDLKPRAGQGGLFSAIRLWVDQQRSIPVQTRLTEPRGDFTVVRFDSVEVNPRLPADAFDLKLPKDVVEVK